MGARGGRREGAGGSGTVTSGRRVRLAGVHARGPEGSDGHAHRRRAPEHQRGAAQEAGTVRELPAGAHAARLEDALQRPAAGPGDLQAGQYVNFRPVRMLPGLKTRYSDLPLDLAIFRENTEDLYSGLEHEVIPDVVESLKIITKTASMKIARAAFEYARRERRRKVTAIHKANIMKMSDGLFLKCCRTVAGEFGEIEYTELIVDNACMQ